MGDVAISCRGLVKRYGELAAVDGLDLEVRRGECFGLLGPNGAGKTTTVEILEGLLEPSAGEVEVLGKSWRRDEAELRRRVGLSLQETHFPERLEVEEVLALFRSFYPAGPGVDELVAMVSLEEKRKSWVLKLSGGQRQRLAVASALAGGPEIIFLDEPTSGLDPQSRRQLWDLILQIKAEGRTIVLTTHYMDEAERLCDRVAIVDRGKVIRLGTPRQLIAALGGSQIIELSLDGEVPDEALAAVPGVQSVRRGNPGWRLTVGELHESLPALLERVAALSRRPTALSTHRATLEDVFVALTGRQLRD
jgi:ABC-2 type transport system ATP-binding protein